MQIQFIDQPIHYDGTQLRSHWIYETTGHLGASLVAFSGGCDVTIEHLVDLEDARHDRPIASRAMLHFIGEFFEASLKETILLQRLLITLIQQQIPVPLLRTGNDLYEGDKKLTVSIATASPVSTLLHAGINIDSTGTPVPTKGLSDYGIEPIAFGQQILTDFEREFSSITRDLAKVRSVN